MDPKLRTLLRQGDRAARLGKTQAAEEVYRQVVAQFPDSAEGWLKLSQVVSSEQERVTFFQRARALDPDLDATAVEVSAPVAPAASRSSSDQLEAIMSESQQWFQQATAPSYRVEKRPQEPLEQSKKAVTQVEQPLPSDQTFPCFYHPNRETTLRCNRCDKPICTRCAINTPVGYRCKECIKEQQSIFYSAVWYDYILALIVTIPLAALAAFIIPGVGWLTIFVSPFAGTIVAEAVRLVTRKRRGRWLPLVVSLGIILGSAPIIISRVWGNQFFYLESLLWHGVFLVMVIGSAFYRVK